MTDHLIDFILAP